MSSLDDMPELVGSDDDMPELVESDHDDPLPPVANYAAQLIRRFGAPLGFFVLSTFDDPVGVLASTSSQ